MNEQMADLEVLICRQETRTNALENNFTLPPNGPSKCRHYIQVFRGSKHFIHINVVRSFTTRHSPFKIATGGI